MVRNEWIMKVRNTLAELATECNSCAAIEGAKMNRIEREALKERLYELVKWIDRSVKK